MRRLEVATERSEPTAAKKKGAPLKARPYESVLCASYFALEKPSATLAQLTTFHHASM
jgi:hypothetical protein